jgi:hypothetical protein
VFAMSFPESIDLLTLLYQA